MKKLIILCTGVIAALFFVTSCDKDKTTLSNVNLNCPDTISFAAKIQPMLNDNCIACHSSGGNSPNLTSHSSVSANASAILNSMKGVPQLMPQGGPALADSLIQHFECWINQGKLNN
jgi:hypothetical protein